MCVMYLCALLCVSSLSSFKKKQQYITEHFRKSSQGEIILSEIAFTQPAGRAHNDAQLFSS